MVFIHRKEFVFSESTQAASALVSYLSGSEKSVAMNDLGEADYERLYRSLRLIRRAEEEIARIYPSDKIKSPVHLSIGQEAVSVGVCDILRPDDVVSPTYRGHAAFLAK